MARAPIVPVLVPVPVPDIVFATTSGVSWSGSIRALVYVNVYRFAVNVYGLTANIQNSAAPPRESSCISTAPAQRARTAFNSTFKIQHSKFGGGAAAPCLRASVRTRISSCLGVLVSWWFNPPLDCRFRIEVTARPMRPRIGRRAWKPALPGKGALRTAPALASLPFAFLGSWRETLFPRICSAIREMRPWSGGCAAVRSPWSIIQERGRTPS